jgi:hypothetical protein
MWNISPRNERFGRKVFPQGTSALVRLRGKERMWGNSSGLGPSGRIEEKRPNSPAALFR